MRLSAATYARALALLALAACTPLRPPTAAVTGALPPATAAPSPGPLPEDPFDDRGLRSLAGQTAGRTGDDAVRARLRLATAQVRAFTLAVLRARSPLAASSARGPVDALATRFAPPPMLVEQLGALTECQPSASADACASGLAAALLHAVATLAVPERLEPERDAVLAALAVLAPTRVPLAPEARWRVLREGEGPAAHLTQALTLFHLATGVRSLAAGLNAPARCAASQRALPALAGTLAIGRCSEPLARWSAGIATGAPALAVAPPAEPRVRPLDALAGAGCAPACAESALSGGADDPVGEAARACADEPSLARFSPPGDAGDAVRTWSRDAWARLRALRARDSAVRALWEWLGPLQRPARAPLPPPLFRAGGGSRVLLPDVASCDEEPPVERPAARVSSLVWVPAVGAYLVAPAPATVASHGEPSEASDEPPDASDVLVERTATEADLLARVSERSVAYAADPANALDARAPAVVADAESPPGIAFDARAAAERVTTTLRLLRGPAGAPARRVALALRNGEQAWFLSVLVLAVAPAAPSTEEPFARGSVARIHARGLWIEPRALGGELRAVGWAGLAAYAIERARAPAPLVLKLEPDATAADLARVLRFVSAGPGEALVAVDPALATGPRWWSPTPLAARASVERALAARADAFARCVAGLSFDAEGRAPRVDLRLSLDARGRAVRVEPAPASAPSAAAVACIRAAARTTRWPAPGAPADLVLPLVTAQPAPPRGTP